MELSKQLGVQSGERDVNASSILRSSLEGVLHGCQLDSPAICSELLLIRARQTVQDVDVRGLFLTGVAGTFPYPANLTGINPSYAAGIEPSYAALVPTQARARRRRWPALL